MDVRCNRCNTEYEFDEGRLTEAGVAVKCTACGNVFNVRKAAPMVAAAAAIQGPREWKVRRSDGQIYALKDLPDLQRWIVERRVQRADEVSLSGDAWRKLGSMPELASFFEVVEAAEKAQQLAATAQAQHPSFAHSGGPTLSGGGGLPPASAFERGGSASWEDSPQAIAATGAAEPAWAADSSASGDDEDLEAEDLKHLPRSKAPLVLLALVLIGGGGAGGYYYWQQQQKAAAPVPPVATAPVIPTSPPPTAVAPPVPTPPAVVPAAAPAPTLPGGAVAATGPAPTAPTGAVAATGPAPPPPAAAPVVPTPKAAPAAESQPEPKTATVPKKAEAGAPKGHDFKWYLSQGHKLLDTKPTQALAMFEQASALNPSSPEPDSGRGIAYSNLEQWAKAIGAFQASLRKSPEYAEAIMGLAESYRYSGSKRQAALYYKKYLQVNPDGADAPAAKAQLENLK